jgi:hypothetical protein
MLITINIKLNWTENKKRTNEKGLKLIFCVYIFVSFYRQSQISIQIKDSWIYSRNELN